MRIIFADSALGTTLGAIVQLIFFLVAAIGSLKLGASAGKFIGIATDPNRGPFNRLKKGRAAIVDSNMHKLKTGTRYSGNRFIPGSTALANAANRTTAGVSSGTRGGFGLGTRRGRAAIAQGREAEAERIRGSAQYATVKENDDALRAGTYMNDAEAMAGLTQHFGGDRNRARNAVAAFHASGLQYSSATQVAAAKGLLDTGTGYKNIEDMIKTGARVSRGNRAASDSLAGYLNARGKEKRPDLTPGYGDLSNAMGDVMTRGQNALSQHQYDQLTVRAMRNSGTVGQMLATAKGTAWENLREVNARADAVRAGTYVGDYGASAADANDLQQQGIVPLAHELKQTNYQSGSVDSSLSINDIVNNPAINAGIAANSGNFTASGETRVYDPTRGGINPMGLPGGGGGGYGPTPAPGYGPPAPGAGPGPGGRRPAGGGPAGRPGAPRVAGAAARRRAGRP